MRLYITYTGSRNIILGVIPARDSVSACGLDCHSPLHLTRIRRLLSLASELFFSNVQTSSQHQSDCGSTVIDFGNSLQMNVFWCKRKCARFPFSYKYYKACFHCKKKMQ